jgi:hypothetical protein
VNGKLWLFAAALLPVGLLSAQQPVPEDPQQFDRPALGQPSPEVLGHATELRQRMRDHAIAINDVASHIRSLDDARKLVMLVADEFSPELPSEWATHFIRERIARAEFATARDPGSLISEQHISDVWNDFVEKIGAPRQTMLSALEIHYLRDAQYVSARIAWDGYEKDIWTIPGVFALEPDGRVANGSRALEAIRLLWQLGSTTDDFPAIHTEAEKGVLLSDRLLHPQDPPAPGYQRRAYVTARIAPPNPIREAAFRYAHDHGAHALNHAIEGLLKDLLAD